MAVSGVSDFDLQFDDLIAEAYERCGIEVRDGYDMKTALRSVNLIFAEWANRGLNLWTIEQRQQILTPGIYEYDLPADTIDGLSAVIRTNAGQSTQQDITIDRIGRAEWLHVPNKLTQSRPAQYYIQRTVPAKVFLFYVADTSTRAQVLTKLATLADAVVNDWPRFQPRTATLFLLGQQVDVSARASLSQSASVSGGADASYTKSEGTAISKSIGVSLRVVTIPPTIHGAIVISNAATVTQNVSAAASVQVTRATAGWLTATYWPARTITTSPNPVTATAAATTMSEAFTNTIPTTPGLTEIPVAGLYARIKMEPWKYGFSQVRAEVVDFSYFA